MSDPLPIRHLEFLGGLAKPGGWRPEGNLPEIAFSGRSNVGKSSLLNRLVRRKALARVSKTPGKTREINFFEVNRELVLVDLPGYGFARVSKEQRAEWRPLIEGYLKESKQLRGVVQLLDVRHAPTADDLQMVDFLAGVEVPTIFVLTKVDKLSKSAVGRRVDDFVEELGVTREQLVPFSSVTGQGRDELAEAMVELASGPAWRSGE
ncbi:MAG TPA: ribosome biogenesis GTP-binding protein YihA/YsxC [Gemmatimonadaceae bacterium]|nr:ribosome biogenesis GTP-binding protein YihA/YsxC [Gemmatimonadaceae bacterium]